MLALFLAIAGMGLFVSLDDYRAFHFRNERDVVVSVLQKARSESMANVCFGTNCTGGRTHGVYLGSPGTYVLFQGASYASRDASLDETISARDAAAHLSGAAEIVFAPGSGAGPVARATLTVTDANGKKSDITIEPSGRIWWKN